MSKSKLGFHIQSPRYPDWLKHDVAQSNCEWAKIINPDAGEAQPFGNSVKYIGRLHFGTGEPDKELIWQGNAGADAWWEMARSRIERASWIDVWEGPNEPTIDNEDKARDFVAFEQRRAEIMHQHGYQVASGCFSTGNPYLTLWGAIGAALIESDYLGLHQYGMRTMDLTAPMNTWHLLRHRFVIRNLEEAGYRVPPIMITETGIDYCGDPLRDGWRAQPGMTPEIYRNQLIAYDHALQLDERVVVATPFTWMHDGWPSFDIDENMSGLLADYMESTDTSSQLELLIGDRAQRWIIPLNPDAAFEKEAGPKGYLPAMPERDIVVAGIHYRYQAFRHPDKRQWQYIAYCEVGDWQNIAWFIRRN